MQSPPSFQTARAVPRRILLMLLLAWALAGCSGAGDGLVGEGDTLPAMSLQQLDDGPDGLDGYRGRLLVVNIWATWCAPCREEMPSLQRLADAMAGEPFALVGLSIDDDANLVREFLLRYDIRFPIVLDPGAVETTAKIGSLGYPDTLVVDAEGRIVRRVTGLEVWDSADMVSFLRGQLPRTAGGG